MYALLGFFPRNMKLYEQAFIHNSNAKNLEGLQTRNSNERLEFLGDAVLGVVMADLLFRKYPFKGEGFLTEMRSKMVSRKKLSELAEKMGIHQHLSLNRSIQRNDSALRGISGNALEALIGAVYLDRGYAFTKLFVERRIVKTYMDLEQLKDHTDNFKSVLNQWCQKNGKTLRFKVIAETGRNHNRNYTIAATIDNKEHGRADGRSKKQAEQLASEIACQNMGIIPQDVASS